MASLLAIVVLGGVAAATQFFRAGSDHGSPAAEPSVDPIVLRMVLDADFERSAREIWSGPQAAADGRVTPVSTVAGKPVKTGLLATRFEVQPGDSNVAGSGEGERAEMYLDEPTTGAGEGVEQWWAWSTYFPSDFDSPGGGWNTFTGFHHTGSTGQVPIQFTANDKTKITLRVLGGNITTPTRKDFTLAELQRGKWYDFVFHVKWSSSGDGFVEVWLDGNRVVPRTSTPTLYPGQGVYLKQGYYRMAYDKTTVIYHDGMRRGTSYAEVAAEFPSGGSTVPSAAPVNSTLPSVSGQVAEGSVLSSSTGSWSNSPTSYAYQWQSSPDSGTSWSNVTGATSSTFNNTSAVANRHIRVAVTATNNIGSSSAVSGKVGPISSATTPDPNVSALSSVTDGTQLVGPTDWTVSVTGAADTVEFFVNNTLIGTKPISAGKAVFRLDPAVHGGHAGGGFQVVKEATTVYRSPSIKFTLEADLTPPPAPATVTATSSIMDGAKLVGPTAWKVTVDGNADEVGFYVNNTLVGRKPVVEKVATFLLDPATHGGHAGGGFLIYQGTQTVYRSPAIKFTLAPQPASLPPAISALPLVSGQLVAGSTLTTTNGTWANEPTSYSYQWQSSTDGATWIGLSGATAASLPLTDAHVGKHVRAVVTATSSGGSGSAASGAYGPVKALTLAAFQVTSSLVNGVKLTGPVEWAADTTIASVVKVEFYIDGNLHFTEYTAPFSQTLDVNALSNGKHTFLVKAFAVDGRVTSDSGTLTVRKPRRP